MSNPDKDVKHDLKHLKFIKSLVKYDFSSALELRLERV